MNTKSDLLILKYLEMDQEELLMEIGRMQTKDLELHAPTALIAKSKEFLTNLRPKLREFICSRKDLLDLPEIKLAVEIAEILSGMFVIPLARAIAVYIVKRGLSELCGSEESDD